MDAQTFHRQTAEQMKALYTEREPEPEGWREILMWHWEQAHAYDEAIRVALEVAEGYISELAFSDANRWTDRVLTILDSQQDGLGDQYAPLSMHTYTLIIAILEFNGQYREALGYAHLLQRLTDMQEIPQIQANCYLILGRVLRELGQLTVAESELSRALTLAERHHMIEVIADSRLHLAKVHQLQGRHLEAFQQLELAHHATTGDQARLARIWTGIGDGYRVLGASREALRLYKRALKMEIDANNRRGQAMLHEKLGLSFISLGQPDRALEHAWMALQLRTDLGDMLGQARSHNTLGTIYKSTGDYERSLKHFEQARDLEEELQNQRGLTIALTSVGDAAWLMGEREYARTNYSEAMDMARKVDDQVALARINERLGDLGCEEGNVEDARAHWEKALSIRTTLGHSEEAKSLRERMAAHLPPRDLDQLPDTHDNLDEVHSDS
jgi:tetratricopeptide (TPR) repeat protein